MTRELFLLLIAAVLLAAFLAVLFYSVRQRQRVQRLQQQIDAFLRDELSPTVNVSDNSFARLENSVAELEEHFLAEQNSTRCTMQENTAFIADVSHQLKTPLASIRLYCELEQASHDPAHTEKQLRLVEKMEKLVFDLLRLEKLRADTYAMEPQITEMGAFLQEIIGEFQPLFPAKHFTLAGTATLRCDNLWMHEAIGNIVKNACEHTRPDGNISLSLTDSDTSVILYIEDDGGGIPEEELPVLFRRFGRARSAIAGGTGIGLAITKAIVEKHHGTVSAENAAKGLRIVLCFPRYDGTLTI